MTDNVYEISPRVQLEKFENGAVVVRDLYVNSRVQLRSETVDRLLEVLQKPYVKPFKPGTVWVSDSCTWVLTEWGLTYSMDGNDAYLVSGTTVTDLENSPRVRRIYTP